MRAKSILPVIAAVLLLSVATMPAMAAPPGDQVDECKNAEEGPGNGGPPGFVDGLVPDFVGDLIGSLPVPNVVKSFVGAPTC